MTMTTTTTEKTIVGLILLPPLRNWDLATNAGRVLDLGSSEIGYEAILVHVKARNLRGLCKILTKFHSTCLVVVTGNR